jgi:hypothetical protein
VRPVAAGCGVGPWRCVMAHPLVATSGFARIRTAVAGQEHGARPARYVAFCASTRLSPRLFWLSLCLSGSLWLSLGLSGSLWLSLGLPAWLSLPHATQRDAMQRNATQRHSTPRHATQRNAMQRNATPRNATPCIAFVMAAGHLSELHDGSLMNLSQECAVACARDGRLLVRVSVSLAFLCLHPSE